MNFGPSRGTPFTPAITSPAFPPKSLIIGGRRIDLRCAALDNLVNGVSIAGDYAGPATQGRTGTKRVGTGV